MGTYAKCLPQKETWAADAWHLAALDSNRGHSRNIVLMHPSYVLVHDSDYWAFHQRPHGLLELVLGDRNFSFPTILPQVITLPLVRSFLAPLIPDGLSCVVVNAWHNGEALDYSLVRCFDGFFVQITVACGRTLMDNFLAAAPTVSLRMHQEVFVLPDPHLVQVTAYVPAGDTLMSSRALMVISRRDVVVPTLQTELRRRFPDMEHWSTWVLTFWQCTRQRSGMTRCIVHAKTGLLLFILMII